MGALDSMYSEDELRYVRGVERAAARLDVAKPDWWQHVDPLTLDLSSPCKCICGQNGLDWRVFYGDHITDKAPFSSPWLEPVWLEEIAKRMPETVPARVREEVLA